jgi:uncharacterized damage-inducible protein DinB
MDARQLLIDTIAHIRPQHALDGLTAADAERCLPNATHSIADIVAHMTFWQHWWCQRCEGQDAALVASAADGWPAVAPGSWPELRAGFCAGLERVAAQADRADRPVQPAVEFPPLSHYTIGDAIVHVAQHNSHHLGQIILLRQLMASWPPPAGSLTW